MGGEATTRTTTPYASRQATTTNRSRTLTLWETALGAFARLYAPRRRAGSLGDIAPFSYLLSPWPCSCGFSSQPWFSYGSSRHHSQLTLQSNSAKGDEHCCSSVAAITSATAALLCYAGTLLRKRHVILSECESFGKPCHNSTLVAVHVGVHSANGRLRTPEANEQTQSFRQLCRE